MPRVLPRPGSSASLPNRPCPLSQGSSALLSSRPSASPALHPARRLDRCRPSPAVSSTEVQEHGGRDSRLARSTRAARPTRPRSPARPPGIRRTCPALPRADADRRTAGSTHAAPTPAPAGRARHATIRGRRGGSVPDAGGLPARSERGGALGDDGDRAASSLRRSIAGPRGSPAHREATPSSSRWRPDRTPTAPGGAAARGGLRAPTKDLRDQL